MERSSARSAFPVILNSVRISDFSYDPIMVEVWIRQRNQLTVPVDIASEAGIGPGSLCHMDIVNGVITLTPAEGPAPRSLDSYAGIARGAWGRTAADVEASVMGDRDAWQR